MKLLVNFYSNIENDKRVFKSFFNSWNILHRFLVEWEYRGGYKWFNYDVLKEVETIEETDRFKLSYSKDSYDLLFNKIEGLK